ncbi:MAG: dienelactone hydrolase family protein [bacterium]
MTTRRLSEADFKALHALTGAAAPAPRGVMVDLGGGQAYLSLPPGATAPVPGVVVIHEWWGLNDHIKHWADRLADDGYAALAVDLYGGRVATTPDEAMAAMKTVDTDKASELLKKAVAFLEAPIPGFRRRSGRSSAGASAAPGRSRQACWPAPTWRRW